MTGKRQKEAFPHGGKSKNDENRLSATGENQKTTKIGFPPRGEIKNQRKSTFRHGGKQEISEDQLSQHWENKKLAKNGFPNIGKNKKCHWLHFPTLGKTKNPESLLSDFRGSVHFDTSSCLLLLCKQMARHYSSTPIFLMFRSHTAMSRRCFRLLSSRR